ncbi:metal-sensitive transcriptional regulator [Paramaledivibacter caminithermalis]|uniref:DNA-binding transcriptional regulator, FrmR family n=1 Tax=Paramaledivibacter caminithermalis (strain DSM 15212 / CIP 107654 / DViRD3) TaxID=1121301 RepID=A0A1M6JW72_PARC5|nr:metal-sensitive transcriptional regulator [Paramaledivibacter caminithermalis]SHJ50899.1 DNA-binding transcriptional regulator, FrmR family [Paramaledivibacter caminithermalis DSM 15212]
MNSYSDQKQSLLRRLKKIEGQVKGIQKMIEDDRYCNDILIQIAAVRSAVNKVGGLILENHLKGCIKTSLANNPEEEVIDELINTMIKFIK